MAREKRPDINISNVPGQVVIGDDNTTIQRDVAASATGPDRKSLDEAFHQLRCRIHESDSADAPRALDRVDELADAVSGDDPDITTMAYVRNWFRRNLPSLLGDVVAVIVHPAVGAAVKAAGTRIATEYDRHFGEAAE